MFPSANPPLQAALLDACRARATQVPTALQLQRALQQLDEYYVSNLYGSAGHLAQVRDAHVLRRAWGLQYRRGKYERRRAPGGGRGGSTAASSTAAPAALPHCSSSSSSEESTESTDTTSSAPRGRGTEVPLAAEAPFGERPPEVQTALAAALATPPLPPAAQGPLRGRGRAARGGRGARAGARLQGPALQAESESDVEEHMPPAVPEAAPPAAPHAGRRARRPARTRTLQPIAHA